MYKSKIMGNNSATTSPTEKKNNTGPVWKELICLTDDYSRNISVKLCSEMTINANFHFSHYMSMATLSCHSNQSSYPVGTKNIIIHFPYL